MDQREELSLTTILIANAIDKLAPLKNQKQLAHEMGFKRPNMLSMIKNGEASVPFTKIPVVAKVLEIDPALLLRSHLRDTWPEFEMVIFQIFGGILTDAELKWLKVFELAQLDEPPIDPQVRMRMAEFLRKKPWEAV